MGVERLRAFLRNHRMIALDTSVFIYQLESNPRYLQLTHKVFQWINRPASRAVTSTITMTELLVHPYRDSHEQPAGEFYGLLSTYPHLEWIAPTLEIADGAARLRAVHRLRTPNALQAATALHAQATRTITNDDAFVRVEGLETLVLEELVIAGLRGKST